MTESRVKADKKVIYPIELAIIFAILSTLFLPSVLFLTEYINGSSVNSNLEILASLEERLENILAMPFNDIPEGKSENIFIESKNGGKLDLKTITLSDKKIDFDCFVEVFPANFSAIKDLSTHRLQRVSMKNALKRITITARWGKENSKHNIQLVSYKANI